MKELTLQTNLETLSIITKQLASCLKPGMIILLHGDLGTGKTTFTQSLCKHLQVTTTVSSPTYTLINEYKAPFPIYHIDLYRLENSQDIEALDLTYHVNNTSHLTLIEWAERLGDLTPDDALSIHLKYSKSNDQRNMVISAKGPTHQNLLSQLANITKD